MILDSGLVFWPPSMWNVVTICHDIFRNHFAIIRPTGKMETPLWSLKICKTVLYIGLLFFKPRKNPLEAQKLYQKEIKIVCSASFTLRPLQQTIVQQNRIKTLHHDRNPLE